MEVIAGQCAAAVERARLADAEHHVAETLQRSLLPAQLPRLPRLTLTARYQPAAGTAQVGGNWYDALPLPNGRVGLVLCDVAGHGVAAAAQMGQMRQVLRAEARAGASPREVLRRINTAVFDLAEDGERSSPAARCYSTRPTRCSAWPAPGIPTGRWSGSTPPLGRPSECRPPPGSRSRPRSCRGAPPCSTATG